MTEKELLKFYKAIPPDPADTPFEAFYASPSPARGWVTEVFTSENAAGGFAFEISQLSPTGCVVIGPVSLS